MIKQRILSFDQARNNTGYTCGDIDAISGFISMVEFGCLKNKKPNTDFQFVLEAFNQCCDLILRLKPDLVLVEAVYLGQNCATYQSLCRIQAVFILAALHSGKKVEEVSPNTVRSAFGINSKEQAAEFVTSMFPKMKGSKLDVTDSALQMIYVVRRDENECGTEIQTLYP
jgi:Holliday junction resolvasome RuvABC endonuclease subunit